MIIQTFDEKPFHSIKNTNSHHCGLQSLKPADVITILMFVDFMHLVTSPTVEPTSLVVHHALLKKLCVRELPSIEVIMAGYYDAS
jgi:hypothetical protein